MEKERNADRAGFTVQKVREVEVLKAARDENTSALLVYASERAVNEDYVGLPQQLKVSRYLPCFAMLSDAPWLVTSGYPLLIGLNKHRTSSKQTT